MSCCRKERDRITFCSGSCRCIAQQKMKRKEESCSSIIAAKKQSPYYVFFGGITHDACRYIKRQREIFRYINMKKNHIGLPKLQRWCDDPKIEAGGSLAPNNIEKIIIMPYASACPYIYIFFFCK